MTLDLNRALINEAGSITDGREYDSKTDRYLYTTSAMLAAIRLAREGWTPPVAVDPDLLELETLWLKYTDGKINSLSDTVLAGIKRGRELERAEAKPGFVWVINRGLSTPDGAPILTRDEDGNFDIMRGCKFSGFGEEITHYAIIATPTGL